MSWIDDFDEDEIREAMEEACVDCYGPSEQVMGLANMLSDELAFPFAASVIGESVEVIGAVESAFDSLGLDLIVQRSGQEYIVAATSVEFNKTLPEGIIYLAAYLRWKRQQ